MPGSPTHHQGVGIRLATLRTPGGSHFIPGWSPFVEHSGEGTGRIPVHPDTTDTDPRNATERRCRWTIDCRFVGTPHSARRIPARTVNRTWTGDVFPIPYDRAGVRQHHESTPTSSGSRTSLTRCPVLGLRTSPPRWRRSGVVRFSFEALTS